MAPAPANRLQVGLVLNGSPAQSAGVQAGDEILQINGVDVASRTREYVLLPQSMLQSLHCFAHASRGEEESLRCLA